MASFSGLYSPRSIASCSVIDWVEELVVGEDDLNVSLESSLSMSDSLTFYPPGPVFQSKSKLI